MEADPRLILSRFGFGPSTEPGSLPHPAAHAAVAFMLPAPGGECLLAVCDETRFPVEQKVDRLDENGRWVPWFVPSCLVAVRGDLAYEFQCVEKPSQPSGGTVDQIHYRLTAIRAATGEAMTFTYGSNGVDFEAVWEAIRLRVALDGMAPTAPVAALEEASPALASGTPALAYCNAEARLRITYEGPDASPGYTVTALARPGNLQPDGQLGGGFPPSGHGEAHLDGFRRNLQVTRILRDDQGETLGFGYGKPPAVDQPGPDGTQSFAPTVLEEISLPQWRFRLEWAGRPQPDSGATAQAWRFGVVALQQQECGDGTAAPTYRPVASAPAPGSPWVRQSRHFALGTGTDCKTYVRDRWELKGATAEQPRPCDPDGAIPTFDLDPQTLTLVPVPGRLTRCLDWTPSLDQPPDMHGGNPFGGGLKGGSAAGPRARLGPISYSPARHEATMGAYVGPFPMAGGSGVNLGPNGPGLRGPNIMAQQIAQNMQATRQTAGFNAATMRAGELAASAARQAMQAQQARQQARFQAMDQQRMAQQQRMRQAWLPVHLPVQQPPAPSGPAPRARHPKNQIGIDALHPLTITMKGKPGRVMVMIWDWQGAGVVGPDHSVGHAALAIKDPKGAWTIVQSQFPHGPGEPSQATGPNILISQPFELRREEGGRKPNSAFLVMVPDLGGLASAGIEDLQRGRWLPDPNLVMDATNCTYGIIRSLRDGGVPLSGMWANQTLVIPGAPYTPRDLRTAFMRDLPFNIIHPYKIYHQNQLIDEISWEK